MRSLLKSLDNEKIKYITDFSLKKTSTFRIGGECALALFPSSAEQLVKCVFLVRDAGIEVSVIGKGSNTLFADGRLNRAIIFTEGLSGIKINGTTVKAEAGESVVAMCVRLADAGLSGAEFACGIPASVGGAVYMNAGAHGGSFSDIVAESTAVDISSGRILTLAEHEFDYRQSVYSKNKDLICLGATLSLTFGESEQIKALMRENLQKRRASQPIEYPSVGSYFKRPEGDFAGRLIDVCGLKGTAVGGACVSEKHAGFIINKGGASFDDVMRLEELVKERVFAQCGVILQREAEVVK